MLSCFAPVEDKHARVLILGSMPGRASLAVREYYAHPYNAFWPIVAALLGFPPKAPYALKLDALKTAGIALWDVLQHCVREGSLDAHIQASSEQANNFQQFFQTHPNICHVFFNGSKAESCFKRHVLKTLHTFSLSCVRLPSTSPAHASRSYAQKLEVWRSAFENAGLKGVGMGAAP